MHANGLEPLAVIHLYENENGTGNACVLLVSSNLLFLLDEESLFNVVLIGSPRQVKVVLTTIVVVCRNQIGDQTGANDFNYSDIAFLRRILGGGAY